MKGYWQLSTYFAGMVYDNGYSRRYYETIWDGGEIMKIKGNSTQHYEKLSVKHKLLTFNENVKQ